MKIRLLSALTVITVLFLLFTPKKTYSRMCFCDDSCSSSCYPTACQGLEEGQTRQVSLSECEANLGQPPPANFCNTNNWQFSYYICEAEPNPNAPRCIYAYTYKQIQCNVADRCPNGTTGGTGYDAIGRVSAGVCDASKYDGNNPNSACVTGGVYKQCCSSGLYSPATACSNGICPSGQITAAGVTSCLAPTPSCNTGISCSGSCNAAVNTCSVNNGTKGSCVYTTYSGGGSCTQVAAPNQSCTTDNCSTGYSCVNGTCAFASGACPAAGDNCVYTSGGGCYSGKTKDTNTCTWVNGTCLNPTSGCTYSCGPVTCPAGSNPTPTPVPPPAPPPPGGWQACGSCAVGCGGDSKKSHCFSGGTDQGCQPSYQCRISPDNTCQWDPGSCSAPSGGGMVCRECGFHMGRFCEPKTSVITWQEDCTEWTSYSWGPLERQIQQNLNDCQYLNEGNGGCSGSWGNSSVGLENCICGSSTADTKITFSNSSPRTGQTFTVYAKSFKNYDQGAGGGSGKDPMTVRLTAFDSSGRMINLGTPKRTSTVDVSSYQCADSRIDTWTGSGDGSPWPQRIYEWDTSLPAAGTYSFQLSVQEQYYVCATASLTATTPPAPAVPTLSPVSCLTGSATSLSWNTVSGASVYEIKVYRTGYSSTSPLIYAQGLTSSPYTFTTSYADQFWWQMRAGNQYGGWSAWSAYSYFNCVEPIRAWIQTSGDVHSNTGINATGGP